MLFQYIIDFEELINVLKNILKNTFKRELCAILLSVLCCVFCACQRTEYKNISEAIKDNALIGENVFIDGIDVSGMNVKNAMDALNKKHGDELKNMSFTVSTDTDNTNISGDKLPINYNTEEVIVAAVNLGKYCPSNNESRELYTEKTLDTAAAQKVLTVLVAPMNRGAVDASAKYDPANEEGFVYSEHSNGECVDCSDAAQKLANCINDGSYDIKAKTRATNAEYTLENAKRDNALISAFSTSFDSKTYSKPNRVFNITKAAQAIDGVRLEVGEEFDMNAILGDRNAKNGWKEATGIRDGKYVQEYGGGVCQVSTTLYNAVLMADLEVTDRSHHSWPLGYIEVGRDATISTGGPNFKFKNTSDAPITVSAKVDNAEKSVTVKIYGRKSDEFSSITVTSKQTGTLDDLGNEIVLDKSLPDGAKEVERESRTGVLAESYKEYRDANGNIIKRELVAKDKYRSVQGIIRVAEDVYNKSSSVMGNNVQITEDEKETDWTEYFYGLQQ